MGPAPPSSSPMSTGHTRSSRERTAARLGGVEGGAQWTEAVTVGAEDVGKDVGVARSLLPGAAADPFHRPRAPPPPVGFPIRAAIANCR